MNLSVFCAAPTDASRYAASARGADSPDAAPSRVRATYEQERAKAKAESTRRERDRALTGTAQLLCRAGITAACNGGRESHFV